jgi:hypothetical protein
LEGLRFCVALSFYAEIAMWCEVRAWQKRQGKPLFVHLDQLEGKRGFRSVYAYPAEVKKLIEERRSTADIHDQSVFSDKLFIDFDNVGCADTLEHLNDLGVEHSVWTSGNRSFHIHVTVEPMLGPDVPYSQRMWVQQNIPDQADLTFYTHAGQFRLPGTLHEKTGQRKVKIQSFGGEPLVIPIVKRQLSVTSPRGSSGGGFFMARLLKPAQEPGRRVFAWHLAKSAFEEGVAYEEALTKILWWNERLCSPPLPPNAVQERVLQVYGKRSR